MRKSHLFATCLSILLVLVSFSAACASVPSKYRVKKGDNLWDLSEKFKVSLTELKEINRDRLKFAGNFDKIFPDQVFLIPVAKGVVVGNSDKSVKSEKKSRAEFLAKPAMKSSGAVQSSKKQKEYSGTGMIHQSEDVTNDQVKMVIISVLSVGFFLLIRIYSNFWGNNKLKSLAGFALVNFKKEFPRFKVFLLDSFALLIEVVKKVGLTKKKYYAKKYSSVGYLNEGGDGGAGYFIIDSNGNWIVNIESIEALASVAFYLYKDNIKAGINYESPNLELALKWRPNLEGSRTLFGEEILEFEKMAFKFASEAQ
ncbi:MAG: hypothetical protein ACD_8C00056G0002 [uncultured bacterium]|nr:MAG: hypothetical protein ACD_8C00056G0002 [uncultured bacterium]